MRSIALFAIAFMLMAVTPAEADYKSAVAAYRAGKFEAALAEFLPLAEAGSPSAELAVGIIFHRGLGVGVDFDNALKWYRRSANQGNMTAQNNLAVMYRRGEGIQKNPKQAFALFWAAAVQGDSRAGLNVSEMYDLGEGTPKDPMMAYVWLELAVSDLSKRGKDVASDRRARLVSELDTQDVTSAKHMAQSLRKVVKLARSAHADSTK